MVNKIALTCSAGGHLTELLQLQKAWQGKNYFFITDKRMDSEELSKKEKVFFVICPRRSFLKLIINFFQSLKLFLKENPNIVISTGADTAIMFNIVAFLFGKKVIFIESFCRTNEPSLSGKIMQYFSSKLFVQWPELKTKLKKANYVGSVF